MSPWEGRWAASPMLMVRGLSQLRFPEALRVLLSELRPHHLLPEWSEPPPTSPARAACQAQPPPTTGQGCMGASLQNTDRSSTFSRISHAAKSPCSSLCPRGENGGHRKVPPTPSPGGSLSLRKKKPDTGTPSTVGSGLGQREGQSLGRAPRGGSFSFIHLFNKWV